MTCRACLGTRAVVAGFCADCRARVRGAAVAVRVEARSYQPKWADAPLPLSDEPPPPLRPGEMRTTLGPYWCEPCKEPRPTELCAVCGGRNEHVPQLANLVIQGPALPRAPAPPLPSSTAANDSPSPWTEEPMPAPRRFAEGTHVTVERSRAELEKLLMQHGASEFAVWIKTEERRHVVAYRIHNRMVRHYVDMPAPTSFQTSSKKRTPEQLRRAAEHEFRRRWRGLVLITKAKLELIASGQSSFEREFLADVVLPNGQLVHELLAPAVARAYLEGMQPKLLLGPGSGEE